MMTLKAKNNPLLHLYNFGFSKPQDHKVNNLCDLFWGVLFGIITIALMPLSFLFSFFPKLRWRTGLDSWFAKFALNVFYFYVFAFCLYSYFVLGDEDGIDILLFLAVIHAAVLILVIIFAIMTYVSEKGYLNKGLTERFRNNVGTPMKEGFKGIKNKYCPMIRWEEDVEEI